jgi:membrane-associated phospholipid phosphatase
VHWEWIAVGYVSYLAVASTMRPQFEPGRRRLLTVAAAAWVAAGVTFSVGRSTTLPLIPALEVVLPALVLLGGYWLSGLLFVRPNVGLETRLSAFDDRVLRRSGVLAWFGRAPGAVREFFELSYLLVYLVVPAGAFTLAIAGHIAEVGRFWAVVLLAEFACYGMLPWVQTRPPRVLETESPTVGTPRLRRLNLGIVNRASIQANTIPSGHAAGALAAALAVGGVMPGAGAVFLVLALAIAVATVLGRYHYVVDSVLGVLVAVAAWALV